MANTCNHNCEECTQSCSSKQQNVNKIEKIKLNNGSTVKKHIAIVSGKGGVGKSLITALLAVELRRRGSSIAIIDADITGPSVPKAFNLENSKILQNNSGIVPAVSKTGISIMSLNLLLQDNTDPVVWRGPILAETVKQFYSNVNWGNVDFMLIDMPPGTGDIPLTVYQSIPIDGIIIVTSPQELVSMIVSKAIKMANIMEIPILGIIENMSYFKCPECGSEHQIFGKSNLDKVSKKYFLDILARIPIDPELAKLTDTGLIELYEADYMQNCSDKIYNMLNNTKSNPEGGSC